MAWHRFGRRTGDRPWQPLTRHSARVESVPDRVGGAWVFRGTRLPVATVIENLEDLSVDEVIEQFDVMREQVTAVLDFVAQSLRPVAVLAGARPLWPRHAEGPGPARCPGTLSTRRNLRAGTPRPHVSAGWPAAIRRRRAPRPPVAPSSRPPGARNRRTDRSEQTVILAACRNCVGVWATTNAVTSVLRRPWTSR